ncbi:hypothetical protein jhhlp_008553 [Lomentospora prolificans]|uniref:Heat shock protein 30 n=1 Tax=Lomentospora prolificans TaxID=41688 RepID=A0A2N3MYD9_9PEZI|nr:hypothetical protein jhhlp_008553 [Lomentospora prolificans]
MASILPRTNRVFESNPPGAEQHLSVNGSNWLWAVTAVFLFSFLIVSILAVRPRYGERVFHYIFSIALLVGGIAYYAMASDLGWLAIAQSNNLDNGADRQIFWAKYVYWVVSFPTVILALGLASGVTWATIAYGVGLSWIWVISYLVSAFTESNYKWGFWVFGTVAWFVLFIGTFTHGRRSAVRVNTQSHFLGLSGWVHLLWLLYPIAFGLSDGGNKIGVTASFIFFGILDVLLIPVLAFAVIALSYKWDYGKLDLHFTRSGRGFAGPYDEKTAANTHNGVGTV